MEIGFGDGSTFEELTDAFLLPPRLVPVGYRHRFDDGQIALISHVEIWTWRVVVVGCRTRTEAEMRELDPRPTSTLPPTPTEADPGAAPIGKIMGAVRVGVGDGADAWRAAITRDIAWYDQWPISDDVGTEFWFVGSPRRSRERLEDFAIERHPAPPPTASTLIIGTPAGDEIRVDLTS